MSIYLRGKSWYYDFVHKGQRYTGSFGPVSRTVAKEEEHRKKTEVLEHRLNPAKARKSPRFDVFAEEYLEWAKTNRKPGTYRRLGFTVPRLVAFFGQKKLSELTAWQIEQYKKARKDAGISPSTINLDLSVINAMLRKAQIWKKLGEHPGKDVRPFAATSGKTRFLSQAEEVTLLAACAPALRRVIEVGVLTGFRRQELAYLQPEDVNIERETVRVVEASSKNGESRTLPMGPRLKALLQETLSGRSDAAPVLVADDGKPWTPGKITDAFRRTAKRAGLGVMGPHILRHTFASRLVMAGVDLRTVQELMGHKSILMTMRYAHLSPDHKRAAMEALERRFPAPSPADFHNTPLTPDRQAGEKLAAIR
jgi:integrase